MNGSCLNGLSRSVYTKESIIKLNCKDCHRKKKGGKKKQCDSKNKEEEMLDFILI